MKIEMKKSSMKAVALAVLALSAGAASAQTLPESLIKAVQKAIVGNPEVQARWHNFTASSAERDAASAGYRPQLDLIAAQAGKVKNTPARRLTCQITTAVMAP